MLQQCIGTMALKGQGWHNNLELSVLEIFKRLNEFQLTCLYPLNIFEITLLNCTLLLGEVQNSVSQPCKSNVHIEHVV